MMAWVDRATYMDDDFDGLIRHSGLAGSYDYDDISESYGYIRDVYKTILTHDLVRKFSLPDSAVLERLTEYMWTIPATSTRLLTNPGRAYIRSQ